MEAGAGGDEVQRLRAVISGLGAYLRSLRQGTAEGAQALDAETQRLVSDGGADLQGLLRKAVARADADGAEVLRLRASLSGGLLAFGCIDQCTR